MPGVVVSYGLPCYTMLAAKLATNNCSRWYYDENIMFGGIVALGTPSDWRLYAGDSHSGGWQWQTIQRVKHHNWMLQTVLTAWMCPCSVQDTLGRAQHCQAYAEWQPDMGLAGGNQFVSSFSCTHWCKPLEFLSAWLLISPVHRQRQQKQNWYAQAFWQVISRPSNGKNWQNGETNGDRQTML